MLKRFVMLALLCLTRLAYSQECEVVNAENKTVAILKTNGAIGVYDQLGGVAFGGITHRDAVSGRQNEIFYRPQIFTRGRNRYCVMSSGGWSEDGVIYDYAGQYIGYVAEEGSIFTNDNVSVGHASAACGELPASLRQRLLAGAARVTLLRAHAAASDYFVGYNYETCSFDFHPGNARARLLIEPIGCEGCGYTYRVIY